MMADFPRWYEALSDEDKLGPDLGTNPSQVGQICNIPIQTRIQRKDPGREIKRVGQRMCY